MPWDFTVVNRGLCVNTIEKLNILLLSTLLQNQALLSSPLDIFKGLKPFYTVSI